MLTAAERSTRQPPEQEPGDPDTERGDRVPLMPFGAHAACRKGGTRTEVLRRLAPGGRRGQRGKTAPFRSITGSTDRRAVSSKASSLQGAFARKCCKDLMDPPHVPRSQPCGTRQDVQIGRQALLLRAWRWSRGAHAPRLPACGKVLLHQTKPTCCL